MFLLQKSPTNCFFYVQYLNLKATGISGQEVPHFRSVTEFPKNWYEHSNYVICMNFTPLCLFLLFGLALLVHSFLIFFNYIY